MHFTTSVFEPRSKPANWYSDSASGTGVTAQELATEGNFLFCGRNTAHRKSFPWSETRCGKRHGLIKISIGILIQRLPTQYLYDLSHKNKVIITVHIFPDGPQLTREYPPVHRVLPVVPDIRFSATRILCVLSVTVE